MLCSQFPGDECDEHNVWPGLIGPHHCVHHPPAPILHFPAGLTHSFRDAEIMDINFFFVLILFSKLSLRTWSFSLKEKWCTLGKPQMQWNTFQREASAALLSSTQVQLLKSLLLVWSQPLCWIFPPSRLLPGHHFCWPERWEKGGWECVQDWGPHWELSAL